MPLHIQRVRTVLAAGKDCELDLRSAIIGARSRLGSSKRADHVGVADLELIPVGSKRLKTGSFNLCIVSDRVTARKALDTYLDGVINITRSKRTSIVNDTSRFLVSKDMIVDADRVRGSLDKRLSIMVVVSHSTRDCHVAIIRVHSRRDTSPQDDAVGIGIPRCHIVGELQLGGLKWDFVALGKAPGMDKVKVDTHASMVQRWTAIVEVTLVACQNPREQGQQGEEGTAERHFGIG